MWTVFPGMHRAPPGTATQPSQWFLQGPDHHFVQHDFKLIKPLVLDGICINDSVPGNGTAA